MKIDFRHDPIPSNGTRDVSITHFLARQTKRAVREYRCSKCGETWTFALNSGEGFGEWVQAPSVGDTVADTVETIRFMSRCFVGETRE